MEQKIRVSKEAVAAFEAEMMFAAEDSTRTLKDVANDEVLLILNNPYCEVEIYDVSSKKVIGSIVAGGIGVAGGLAAVVGGGAAVAGSAAAVGGASFLAAAAPAAVPVVGWLIAGIALLATSGVAVMNNSAKKKAEKTGASGIMVGMPYLIFLNGIGLPS